MDEINIDGVISTPLKIIETPGGNVKHAVKASDKGFESFGEAYFSYIEPGSIKAWKKHKEMTMNLIVPQGRIKFVIYDDREGSTTKGAFQEVIVGEDNYVRVTVPPMVWMGFAGVDNKVSMLLNVSNIEHRPEEQERKSLEEIDYNW
ncbi:dTDP-4-dehydrorhamnose 3,5-epimerase [Vibrio vulnificus]|uniref:dTDP-4-dehydrorhamnose 3,5-epimerase n=1 Tax=Vibrio vulnificus TaxID=672 RepID=UPI0028A44A99|nr:dTDP-4-dehydrorhamnose 3,5-epimerase family protein [Vibrio vulnificus]